MNDYKRYRNPEKLLFDLGVCWPNEIDLNAIAQFCDATIVYKPLDGCDALIMATSKKAIIEVNSKTNPLKQRFSAGHELGHWMFDREKRIFFCTEEMFERRWEIDHKDFVATPVVAR